MFETFPPFPLSALHDIREKRTSPAKCLAAFLCSLVMVSKETTYKISTRYPEVNVSYAYAIATD